MTIQRHMFVQLLVALLVVTSALSSVLTLGFVFASAPSAVLYSKAILPVFFGALTINFCNVMPVGMAVAATWYYTNLVDDHAVDVLYATGFSHFSVILPALLLAVLAAAAGFYLSLVEVPRGWSRVLDAIYIGTHNVDPSTLEPQHFYTLNDNSRTFYFGRRIADNEIAEVFMQERAKDGGERSISSQSGNFVRTPGKTLLYLVDAVLQTRKAGERAPAIVSVDKLWIDSGMRGSATPERNAKYLAELDLSAFSAGYDQGDANYHREWIREAFKRTISPILTVIYLLAGVRLALIGLGGRQERPWKLYVVCVGVIVHHAILLLTIDALIGLDGRLAWAIIAAIVIEICMGIAVNSAPPTAFRGALAPSSGPPTH
ncbi:LptF/LptG family permease [Afipia sp. GAS231]|uniref:LptF/LptG family permease n=1 Tax=Afipia sp. GAS231 TaxID=1882747 RepID=UPI00087D8DC8|nr:LptF/LptG family permease [Afipia sp. GAS231]SDO34716.1 Lipopolysaccharide export LptBFGC system, permease protein LptF [Afipia sp. GAS231]